MPLSPEHDKIIREATRDETSYHNVLSVIEDLLNKSNDKTSLEHTLTLELDNNAFNLLQAVVESLPIPTYVKDTNSRFVLANQLTAKMIGVESVEDLYGKTDFDLYDYDRAKPHYEDEQIIFNTGIPIIEKELTSVHEDGFRDWHRSTKAPIRDYNNNIIGLIGINREVTDEKRVQIKLMEERNLLLTIIDSSPDKIYIKDRQSRFILVNHALCKAFNRSYEQMIGSTDFDLYDNQELANKLFQEEQALLESGESIINQENMLPASITGDMTRWYLVSKIPLRDERDQIYGLVGINREITTIKLAEQQRIELELERERSRILTEFITNSSHEFRTPLSTIQTSTYLMRNANNMNQIKQYADRIESQINRLTGLLESLHTMSRLDKETQIELRPLNLPSLILMVFSNMQDEFEKHFIEAEIDITASAYMIYGDGKLLALAVKEILENAVRYTTKHGQVKLSSYVEDEIPIIEVTDTGIGMTDEVIQHIFKRFYRADESHTTRGFGLGLSIANKIVELHHGYIEVHSQPEQGSIFRLVLPQEIIVQSNQFT